jgi:hypothetical protein
MPAAAGSAPHAAGAAHVDLGLAFGRYTLALPRDARARLALGWLVLGVAALAASGILAVLLVLSRTPVLARLFPVADFFRAALVAHVDLSVLVWFLAFAGVLWSLNSTPRFLPAGWAALGLAALGAAAMAIAPFAGGTPIMANYIPVLDAPAFLGGLALFGLGVTLLVARGLFASPLVGMRLDGTGALRFGLNGAIVATAVALLAFGWSYAAVPGNLDPKGYYELLLGRRACCSSRGRSCCWSRGYCSPTRSGRACRCRRAWSRCCSASASPRCSRRRSSTSPSTSPRSSITGCRPG